jgi:hypothetical protein
VLGPARFANRVRDKFGVRLHATTEKAYRPARIGLTLEPGDHPFRGLPFGKPLSHLFWHKLPLNRLAMIAYAAALQGGQSFPVNPFVQGAPRASDPRTQCGATYRQELHWQIVLHRILPTHPKTPKKLIAVFRARVTFSRIGIFALEVPFYIFESRFRVVICLLMLADDE